jgi:hypothetical protein
LGESGRDSVRWEIRHHEELLAALMAAKRQIDAFLSACDAKDIKDSFSGMDKASDEASAAIAKAAE